MNQRNPQNKTPNSGPEMRQLVFLAVILAALLVVVMGLFFGAQIVKSIIDQNDTPPIGPQTPGNNWSETVTAQPDDNTPEGDKPGFFQSIWAGITNLFSPADAPEQESQGAIEDPQATYPFAGNALAGSAIPVGSGKAVADSTTHSKYAILVNAADGSVLASELADERMYPASLTKVMTLLVAVEHLPHEHSLQDRVKITEEVQEEMRKRNSSGMLSPKEYAGDELSVESMLYAIALESDGVACIEIAKYIAGSEQAFVELMNQKAQELGLTGTHFVNTHGLHEDDHYTTAREMAAIMRYTMQNELCAKIMSTERYNATGYYIKNGQPATYTFYFSHSYLADALGRYPAFAKQVPIVAAKTGLETQAKSCLVSYIVDAGGNAYVCVTAFAENQISYMEDHAGLYNTYAK
jgi:D-alanyl-D-alanine carboxypeptidase (penicillin-binding protein 5/6)